MFEFLLQIPATTTGDSVANLLIAISLLVGAIGGIAGTVATIIAQRTKGKAQEIAKEVIDVSNFTVESAKQVVNAQDKIKGLANVVIALSPQEAKKYLDDSKITIEKLTADVEKTTENLNELGTYLPVKVEIDANHNGIPDELEIPEGTTWNLTKVEEKKD